MRGKLVTAFAATAAIALGVGMSVAMSSPKISSPTTLQFTDKTVQQRFLDVDGSKSFTLGDEFVFTDELRQAGKVVGHGAGHCTATGKHPARFECEATFKVAGGTIGLQTTFIGQGKNIRLIVTGGTGTYRNARGSGVLTQRQNRAPLLRLELLP